MSVHAASADEDEAAIGDTEEERPGHEWGKSAQEVWVKDEEEGKDDDGVVEEGLPSRVPDAGELCAVGHGRDYHGLVAPL